MQHHHLNQSHLSSGGLTTPGGATSVAPDPKRGKKRGSYNCGRCGQPKKGHSCHVTPTDSTPSPADSSVLISATSSLPTTRPPTLRQAFSHLRRALSFEDDVEDMRDDLPKTEAEDDEEELDFGDLSLDLESGGLPANCLWDILRRLPPPGILAAARVCRGWRESARRVWRAAEELKLRIPARAHVGFVESVLKKCPGLVRLSLRIESDVDSTLLVYIASSCPNLEVLEISKSDTAVNWITGDGLGCFVANKRCLKSLKMEGCSNLGAFVLCSSSLSTLWLSDLCSLSKTVFNCPNLKEISLEFSRRQTDSTDLTTVVDGLGRNCPRLQNIHIASVRLSHSVVLALTASQLRCLRMLSLVLGSEITDASVAAIASSYPNLELLDLSGSSISDCGIGMICNVFTETLSRLLLALCPNVTSRGIQVAAAQLPLLELMDCGMTVCDRNPENQNVDEKSDWEFNTISSPKLHLAHEKLIIEHNRLKKLSLWGCSGLDALYLKCPELNDLNLNSCWNLHPERLLLQCHSLESVHASRCQDLLIGAIESQVSNNLSGVENVLPSKRLADGSKRVGVPHFLSAQAYGDEKKKRRVERQQCNVIVS